MNTPANSPKEDVVLTPYEALYANSFSLEERMKKIEDASDAEVIEAFIKAINEDLFSLHNHAHGKNAAFRFDTEALRRSSFLPSVVRDYLVISISPSIDNNEMLDADSDLISAMEKSGVFLPPNNESIMNDIEGQRETIKWLAGFGSELVSERQLANSQKKLEGLEQELLKNEEK